MLWRLSCICRPPFRSDLRLVLLTRSLYCALQNDLEASTRSANAASAAHITLSTLAMRSCKDRGPRGCGALHGELMNPQRQKTCARTLHSAGACATAQLHTVHTPEAVNRRPRAADANYESVEAPRDRLGRACAAAATHAVAAALTQPPHHAGSHKEDAVRRRRPRPLQRGGARRALEARGPRGAPRGRDHLAAGDGQARRRDRRGSGGSPLLRQGEGLRDPGRQRRLVVRHQRVHGGGRQVRRPHDRPVLPRRRPVPRGQGRVRGRAGQGLGGRLRRGRAPGAPARGVVRCPRHPPHGPLHARLAALVRRPARGVLAASDLSVVVGPPPPLRRVDGVARRR